VRIVPFGALRAYDIWIGVAQFTQETNFGTFHARRSVLPMMREAA
jgi:hypothetical protein